MRISFCVVAVAALLTLAPAANAAFPGANGKIAFDEDDGCFHESANVYVMDLGGPAFPMPTPGFTVEKRLQPAWSPDGVRLAYYQDGGISTSKPDYSEHVAWPSQGFDEQPAWSPDGTRIAYASFYQGAPEQVWVANADGTNPVQLTFSPGENTEPAWSPNGSKLAFTSTRDGDPEIFVMNADGSDQTQITSNSLMDESPDWSPDMRRFVFERSSEIWTMDPDGGNAVQLTSNSVPDLTPAWSPDGTQIAFSRGGAQAIWTMDAAGGSQTQRSNQGDSCEERPDWQPLPAAGYPRPRSASSMYISLVPAYARCAEPNRSHGTPLSSGSCASPALTSVQLTLGTPDANGVGAKSVGAAIATAKGGNPSTPADEADVRLNVNVTDVRSAGGLGDYAGALEARPVLRITDRDNAPNPGGLGPGTVTDQPFPFAVPCTPTADTTVGSTCAVATTAETVVPGAVKEGKRTIWALDGFEVRDGNGAPFLRQGLFAP
jgi:Tol biopolymer transport system component